MTATHNDQTTRHPMCDRDDREFVAAAQLGGPERDRLVESCMPLVARVARNYRGAPSIDRSELMQEGVVGLLRALERYDPTMGTPFWAYASWWVRQAMQQLVCELTGPVVLSDRAVRQLARVRDAERRWYQAHGYEPSPRELSSSTGLAQTQVESLQAAACRARGLDDGGSGDGDGRPSTLETLADPRSDSGFDRVTQQLTAAELPDMLATLTRRERDVLSARFGLGGHDAQTLREVAAGLSLSAERVRQIEQAALGKIREFADA
jgi:RNA polymerase sigma factor (sigma-70 family)